MKSISTLLLSLALLSSPTLQAQDKSEPTPKKQSRWVKPLLYGAAAVGAILAMMHILSGNKKSLDSEPKGDPEEPELNSFESVGISLIGGSTFKYSIRRETKNGPIIRETYSVNNKEVSKVEYFEAMDAAYLRWKK